MALRALLPKLNQDPAFLGVCERLSLPAPTRTWVTGLWGPARAFYWAGVAERSSARTRSSFRMLCPACLDAHVATVHQLAPGPTKADIATANS